MEKEQSFFGFRTTDFLITTFRNKEGELKTKVEIVGRLAFSEGFIEEMREKGVKEIPFKEESNE